MDGDEFGILKKVFENEDAVQLLKLIQENKYLLIGGQGLAAYLPPRYTADYDFLLDARGASLIKKQLHLKGIPHSAEAGALRIDDLSIDILDASKNTIQSRVLSGHYRMFKGFRIPTIEGFAALKFVSMLSRESRSRQLIDVSDFIALVTLPEFDRFTLTSFYRDTDRINALVAVLNAIEAGEQNSNILSLLEKGK